LADEYLTVKKNEVELPDGGVINDFYTVKLKDSVLIGALAENGTILLKSEYRYACEEDVIECPAGMIEKGELPLEAVKRELLEETDYESKDWISFGPTHESTSKLSNVMYLFLAKNCKSVSLQHLDKHEHLDFMEINISEAIDMVMSGKVNSNSSDDSND